MRISTVLSYWDYKRHVYQNNFPQKKNPPKRSFVPPFFSWTVFQWCTIRFLLVRKTTWFSLNSEITICFNEDNKGLMEYDRQRRKKINALHNYPSSPLFSCEQQYTLHNFHPFILASLSPVNSTLTDYILFSPFHLLLPRFIANPSPKK